MKNIIKHPLFLTGLLLLTILGGWYLYRENEKRFYEEYGQFSFYVPEYIPDEYSFFENKQVIAYNWKLANVHEEQNMARVKSMADPKFDSVKEFSHNIFVNSYMKLKEKPSRFNAKFFNRNIPEEGEYWKVSVYNIEDDKLLKRTWDIFDMVRSYDENMIPSETGSSVTFDSESEKRYLKILLRKKSTTNEFVHYIDLEKGEIVPATEVNSYTNIPNGFIIFTDFEKKIEKSGLDMRLSWMTLDESYSTEDLEKTLLAKKYPEVYKIMRQEGARIDFLTAKTNVALVKNVTELFFPPGTNVFENVTIPAEYSVDGQEHVVNSAEELERYYKEGE